LGVHAPVYTDPLLYEQEMRQIFEQSWLYIGHESEVVHPGDYRTGRRSAATRVLRCREKVVLKHLPHPMEPLSVIPYPLWRRVSRPPSAARHLAPTRSGGRCQSISRLSCMSAVSSSAVPHRTHLLGSRP
jgi:hypothetical protein